MNKEYYEQLLYACKDGNLDAIKALLQKGDYINGITIGNKYLSPPLCVAAINNRLDIVDYLFENGADPNHEFNDSYGYMTPIINNIISSDAEDYYEGFLPELNSFMVEYFIKHGADINKIDEEGNTSLDWATRYNHHPSEKVLKKYGAKYSRKFLIIEYNRYYPDLKIENEEYIEQKYVEKEYIEKLKDLPYHLEIFISSKLYNLGIRKKYELDLLEHLIIKMKYFKDINEKNEFGKTPVDYAIELGHTEAVKFLRENGGKTSEELYN
jgi:ankyrin repeat protein